MSVEVDQRAEVDGQETRTWGIGNARDFVSASFDGGDPDDWRPRRHVEADAR